MQHPMSPTPSNREKTTVAPYVDHVTFKANVMEIVQHIPPTNEFCVCGSIDTGLAPDLQFKFAQSEQELKVPLSPNVVQQWIQWSHPTRYGDDENAAILDPPLKWIHELDPIRADELEEGKEDRDPHDLEVKGDFWLANQDSFEKESLDVIRRYILRVFGIPHPRRQHIQLRLHSLFVMDAGCFNQWHQMSDQASNGRFALCFLNLPVEGGFEGGELMVRRQDVVRTLPVSADTLSFSAFFSDCFYCIQPLRSGLRVSLVYELVDTGHHRQSLQQVVLHSLHAQDQYTRRLAAELQIWLQACLQQGPTLSPLDPSYIPGKWIIPLGHVYSKQHYGFAYLTAQDSNLFRFLLQLHTEQRHIRVAMAELMMGEFRSETLQVPLEPILYLTRLLGITEEIPVPQVAAGVLRQEILSDVLKRTLDGDFTYKNEAGVPFMQEEWFRSSVLVLWAAETVDKAFRFRPLITRATIGMHQFEKKKRGEAGET